MLRRIFTKRFKEAAIRELRRGTPEQEVARDCRVNRWILRRWQKELDEFGERAFGGYGTNRRNDAEPKSKRIILYLSADDFDAVKAAASGAGFRSLAEFARSRILCAADERPPVHVETVLGEISAVALKLTQRLTAK